LLHFPNAKINIGLFVTEKRKDGYHNLETVFFPLRMLKDALEVLPAAEGNDSSIRISGKSIVGNAHDNLVWKAFLLLQKQFPDRISPVQIHLLKSIPMGAGLGGGSADGAFMLSLLNKFFNLELSDEDLLQLALQLGSDCPFFIHNIPQFAQGRGEVLSPVALDLSNYSIQVICPNVHVSTAVAFSKIRPKAASFNLLEIQTLPVEQWKDFVINDFETPIFESHPQLSEMKQKLYDDGALFASMSGSGSAIYGIFREGERSNSFAGNEDTELYYFE
jgi:4-diphosphocytidyl-2-C-methyl-D-erythritol kinase